jgi:hypothetical protein
MGLAPHIIHSTAQQMCPLVFVPQHLAEQETDVGTLPQIQILQPLPTC